MVLVLHVEVCRFGSMEVWKHEGICLEVEDEGFETGWCLCIGCGVRTVRAVDIA